MTTTAHASRPQPLLVFAGRWLGLRPSPPAPLPLWLSLVWAFVGAFAGLAVLQAVFGQSEHFTRQHVPPIVASYGASAVLCFGVIESPLAQPRALLGGHLISAVVGIVVAIAFRITGLRDEDPTPRLSWLASSLATAVALVLMLATKTTHPPAGATALLPITSPPINRLGWYLLPVVLLSSSLLMAVAMLTNNIQRRYPLFWWSPPRPEKPGPPPELPKAPDEPGRRPPGDDVEKQGEAESS
ncbi:hypothetical protein CDD83_4567 [Cordyceps sp. RAO-2017]|nr:hypothetical protein CDD83_4567 [Cordyceps sp. RAO-2017]